MEKQVLIKELQVPFFKRKCLRIENAGYAGALKALEYMEQEGRYDTRLIWENLFRLCRQGMFSSVLDYDSLECFYNRYKRIYMCLDKTTAPKTPENTNS